MKIKVGDRVRFLNDVGGGKVSRIIDKMSVMVENEFGFDVPSPITELVIIESAINYNETKVQAVSGVKEETESVIDIKDIFYPDVTEVTESGNDINISYAFVPQGRAGNSNLDIYLINDSNYNILYSIIEINEDGIAESNAAGVLEANTKEQTGSIALTNINKIPEYEFHLVFYKKGVFEKKKPESITLKINPVRFMRENSYTANDFFDENAILFPLMKQNELNEKIEQLSKSDFSKIVKEKEKKEAAPIFESRKAKQNETIEVDLHIHELLDDFRGLSNGEIMEVQLNHFKTELNNAIIKGSKRVVFIHGVGNGSLKQEIRKELDRMKTKLSYQDASFKDYGYGATMVFIK